jgi:hypothetical protein
MTHIVRRSFELEVPNVTRDLRVVVGSEVRSLGGQKDFVVSVEAKEQDALGTVRWVPAQGNERDAALTSAAIALYKRDE